MDELTRRAALRLAFSPQAARRSVLVALALGTVLNAINQGDALLLCSKLDLLELLLSHLVPSVVPRYRLYTVGTAGLART